jgi:hypothetical protein
MFALVLALAVSAMAAGNGNTGNGQNKNDFVGTGTVDTMGVDVPGVVFQGTADVYIEITLKNPDNRGMPDITLWLNGKLIKSWDSISSNGSVTYKIPVDTSVLGTQTFKFAAYSRFGHKQWEYEFFSGDNNGIVTIEVIEQKPEFPEGIGTDKDGNLIIDTSLLGGVLPQSNGQNWITITVKGVDLRTGGQGGAQFSTNKKTIKIFNSALVAGVVKIVAKDPNKPATFTFRLIMDDYGNAVGAVVLCSVCLEAEVDCVCEE